MAKKVLIFVIFVVVIVTMKFQTAGEDSDDIKADMQDIIISLPCYDQADEYLDKLFERHHETSFLKSYEMGGRRQSATFDQNTYIQELFTRMIKNARDASKKDVVECLQLARGLLTIEEPEE